MSTTTLHKTVEAAALLRLHPKTLRRYASTGQIGCYRPNAWTLLFSDEHLAEYLAKGEVPTAASAPKAPRNPRKTYAS